MERKIGIIETSLRDGQQSLWATRMTTAMMLPILPVLDRGGFEAVECMGTAVMDSCVRYLKENPWERLRLLREGVPRTPLQMISVCMGFSVGIGATADDVMDLFFRRCAANGIDRFFFMDGLNDIRNFEVPIRAAKAMGKTVLGGIVYSISPVHTDAHFVGKVRELARMGADIVVLKDPNGVLTPERTATLAPAMREAAGTLPLACHSHCVTGLGPATNIEAAKCGATSLWTAAAPLANGSSLPATQSLVRYLRRMGYRIDVDDVATEEIAEYLRQVAARHDKPVGCPAEYDPSYYEHQMPGGMISNFRAQLTQIGIGDRLEEVLAEIPAVRADLGWSLMVTPFSQIIGTQAALNVLYGRYHVILDEVKKLALGHYGQTPAPVDPNIVDRVGGGTEPITARPGALLAPALEGFRSQHGPFASDEEMLLAYFFMPDHLRQLRAAGPIRTADTASASPLVSMLREVARRGDVTSFQLVM